MGDPAANVNRPSPVPRRIDIELEVLFTTARSATPSPLKSPPANPWAPLTTQCPGDTQSASVMHAVDGSLSHTDSGTDALPKRTLVSVTDIGKRTGFDAAGGGCG